MWLIGVVGILTKSSDEARLQRSKCRQDRISVPRGKSDVIIGCFQLSCFGT